MAVTHAIGGTSFTELNSSGTRMSLGCYAFSATQDIKRFHVPGSNGNFVMHCGRTGGKVIAKMRYLGALATILSNYQTDREAWEDTAVTIVTTEGETLTRCLLSPGGMSISANPTAFGRSGKAVMDVVATFDRDS